MRGGLVRFGAAAAPPPPPPPPPLSEYERLLRESGAPSVPVDPGKDAPKEQRARYQKALEEYREWKEFNEQSIRVQLETEQEEKQKRLRRDARIRDLPLRGVIDDQEFQSSELKAAATGTQPAGPLADWVRWADNETVLRDRAQVFLVECQKPLGLTLRPAGVRAGFVVVDRAPAGPPVGAQPAAGAGWLPQAGPQAA